MSSENLRSVDPKASSLVLLEFCQNSLRKVHVGVDVLHVIRSNLPSCGPPWRTRTTCNQREVFNRNGMWLCPGEWGGPREGEELKKKTVRYRTVGDMSCTGAVESTAASPGFLAWA